MTSRWAGAGFRLTASLRPIAIVSAMNPEELSELVSLYVLNALDEETQARVAGEYAHSPAFQAAVAELEATVAMMAYDGPILPLSPNLKQRLFERIAPAAAPIPDQEWVNQLLEQSTSLRWKPYRPVPSMEVAIVRLDKATRQVDCFLRSAGSAKFPPHRHAAVEEIVILQGDLVIDGQVYGKGDRIYSQPGTVHQPETWTGCIVFIRASLDDELLE